MISDFGVLPILG